MLFKQGLLGRAACPGGWYPDHGPPTLDDSFVSAIPAGWNYSRSSANATDCLYNDATTAPPFTTYASNAPRFLSLGLLMEPQRTNLFLNSEAPVTQTIAVTNGQAYTVWMHGTGNVAVAGSGASGTATHGAPYFFTANATGNVTCTLTAPVTRVQFENGPGPTSYIASGVAAVTRTEDRIYKNYLGSQLNVQQGTYWIEWSAQYAVSVAGITRLVVAGVGSYSSDANTDQIICYAGSPNTYSAITCDGSGAARAQSSLQPLRLPGSVQRTAAAFDLHRCRIAQDGNIDLNPLVDPNGRPATLLAVSLFGGGNNVPMNGFLRAFKYWPVPMNDDALKECTTPGYYTSAPAFKIDFMTGVLPRNMNFFRAATTGVATDSQFTDAAGSAYNTFGAPPAARFTSRGLLLEAGRNNYYPAGNAPITRASLSLTANQGYKLWVIGTGSVTVSPGTTTPTTGNGGVATQGNPLFVQTGGTAGTVTLTVAGTVNRAMLEQVGNNVQVAALSTFLQNTTSLQSRGAESLNVVPGAWFNGVARTYYYEFYEESMSNAGQYWQCGSLDTTEREQMFVSTPTPSVAGSQYNIVFENLMGAVGSDPGITVSNVQSRVVHKTAIATSQTRRVLAFDGVLTYTTSNGKVKPAPAMLTINTACNSLTGGFGSRYARKFSIYDYDLSDADLVALTT